MATNLVVVEHASGKLVKATLAAVAAAQKIGGAVHALVLGKGVADVANAVAPYVAQVHVGEHADLGVDVTPKLKIVKLETPPKRTGGRKVGSVQELVQVLHNEAKVI